LIVALFSLGLLGVTGCGPDNETEAQKLAKTAGDPGAVNPKGLPETKQAPVTTQEEFHKQAMEGQQKTFKAGGYPGGKK